MAFSVLARRARTRARAVLVDEMHLEIAPLLLGSGEHLLGELDLPVLGYACTEHVPSAAVTHITLSKRDLVPRLYERFSPFTHLPLLHHALEHKRVHADELLGRRLRGEDAHRPLTRI